MVAERQRRGDRLVRLFAPIVAGRRLVLVVLALLSIAGGLLEALALVLIARAAFALAGAQAEADISAGPVPEIDGPVGVVLLVTCGLVLARLGLQVFAGWLQAGMSAGALVEARQRTTSAFFGASWSLQSRERQGQLQELSTTFVTQAIHSLNALVSFIVAACNLLALIVSALLVNPVGAAYVALSAAGLLVVLRPFRSAVRRRSRVAADMSIQYAAVVSETAGLAREIRVYDVGEAVQDRLDAYSERSATALKRTRVLNIFSMSLYQNAALLMLVAALGIAHAVGADGLASLGAVVLIMLRSLSYSQACQQQYQALFESAPYVEHLRDKQEEYRNESAQRALAVGASHQTVRAIDEIRLEDVCFEYVPGRPVLSDVSFGLERGEIVGIVGPSGGGKSTLVQLLLRLREPTSGELRVNGLDVQSVSLANWYRLVASVPQEAGLFAGTVADNIRFFRDVDDAAVEAAARRAHIDDDIRRWPLGYESPVGEQGGSLSGGQKQRLCIARALVNQPDLLVLDEPTSALDVRSESLVRDTLEAMRRRTTVVIVAHRLSTLEICDRIMVLQHGAVTGFDAPTRLEAENRFYREALKLSGLR